MSKKGFDFFAVGIFVISLLFFTPYKRCWGEYMQICDFLGWYGFFETFNRGGIFIDLMRLFVQEGLLVIVIYIARRYKYSDSLK